MLKTKVTEIERLNSAGDVWKATVRCLAEEGFPHVIYITAQTDGAAPRLLTTTPAIHAGGPIARDPFLRYCCATYEPTLTGVAFLDEHRAYLDEEDTGFIGAAAAAGFVSGLGIPTRLRGAGRYGGFNLGTGLDRAAFEGTMLPRRDEFRLFCLLVHRRMEELGLAAPIPLDTPKRKADGGLGCDASPPGMGGPRVTPLDDLSPREREVMWLQAQGLPRKDVARLCGISPHTVAEYTGKAYRKLGVHNRAEATKLILGRGGFGGDRLS